jgi:hypothetical protein
VGFAPRSSAAVSGRLKLTPLNAEYQSADVKDEGLQRRLETMAEVSRRGSGRKLFYAYLIAVEERGM